MKIDIIKKITVLFVVLVVGNIAAMDCISRKESKFDFLKLHELQSWHEKLSDQQREAIQNNLVKQDQNSLALFKFATELPLDVQKLVVAHMFDGYSYEHCAKESPNNLFGEYANAVNEFYEKPASIIFKDQHKAVKFIRFLQKSENDREKKQAHFGTFQVYATNPYQSLMPLLEDPCSKPHIIFEFLEDLFVFNVCDHDKVNHDWLFCSKNELQSMNRALNTFSKLKKAGEVKYKFHDSLTLDNFKKQFHGKQFRLLPIFLSPFISRLISKFLGEAFIYQIDQDIDRNKVRECINLYLNNKYEETGNLMWLSEIRKLTDPLMPYFNDTVAMSKYFMYITSLGVPIINKIANADIKIIDMPIVSFAIGTGILAGISASWGIACLTMEKILLNKMPILMQSLSEYSLLSIGCVTGLYALIVSLYNIKKMRTSREETVSLSDLSALLQRMDIVIE